MSDYDAIGQHLKPRLIKQYTCSDGEIVTLIWWPFPLPKSSGQRVYRPFILWKPPQGLFKPKNRLELLGFRFLAGSLKWTTLRRSGLASADRLGCGAVWETLIR